MRMSRNFLLTFLATFFFFAGFYVLLPVMPRYAEFLGGEELSAGLVMGLFTISAVVVRPFVGRYVDRRGCRKMMIGGSFIFLLAPLSYIASGNLETLYLTRIFHGLGIAFFTVGATTLVSQTAPQDSRGETLGFYTISTIFAMALFPWVGDVCEGFSFSHVFAASSLLALLSLILSFFVSDFIGDGQDNVVPNRFLLVPTVVIFCTTFSYGAIVSFIPLITEKTGFFYFLYASAVIASRLTLVPLSDKYGRKKIIIPSLGATVLGVFILAFDNESLIVVSAIIYGIGFGTAYPTLNALIVDKVKKRGEALSIFSAAFDGGIAVGSVLLGAVAQYAGFSLMFLFSASVVLSGFFLFIILSRNWSEERL